MARHTLMNPFDKFRGSVAHPGSGTRQTLYDDPHRGKVSRNYTKTPNPRTSAQIGQRTRIALCAQAWRALTAAQANAWRALAAGMNRTSDLGFTYQLTGINVFYMVNVYRLIDAQAITTTPPDILGIPPPTLSIAWFGLHTTIFSSSIAAPGFADGCKVLIRLSNSSTSQARQRRRCELRIPTVDTSTAFSTVATQSLTYYFTPDTISLTIDEWCAYELIAMSAEYLPRAPLFCPLRLVANIPL